MLDAEARLRSLDLDERLIRLGFRDHDRRDVRAAITRVLDDGGASSVQALAQQLVARIGGFLAPNGDDLDDPWTAEQATGYGPGILPMLAMIVTAEDVVAFHRSRGLSAQTSWSSLADLGQQVWVHRLTYREFGLHTHGWLLTAWSGALLWLGRLQFNLQAQAGDDWVLSTHIPQSGPLTPAEVDDSFERARTVFPRSFPEHPTRTLHCHSWLLDPQLVEVLPPDSNLVRFQRRWQLFGEPSPGDDDVIFFVFRRRGPVDPARLPQTTSLERAVVRKLRTGGHWQVWSGLIPTTEGS